MEYNIRAYVDGLLRDAPETQRAFEMKEELIQNLLDKYNDLVESGKSPEDAYNITIYGIGDISELLAEMEREEPARGGEDAAAFKYYEAMYYFRRRRAALLAAGIAFCVFGLVPCIVLSVLAEANGTDFLAGVGVGGMFVFWAVGAALIVFGAVSGPKRSDPPEMAVRIYLQKTARRPAVSQGTAASIYWTLLVSAYLLLSFLTNRWDITWLMFLAAPAGFMLMRALHAAAAKNTEEEERK